MAIIRDPGSCDGGSTPPGTIYIFVCIPFFSYIITCIIKTDFYNFLMKSSIEFNKKIRVYY